MRSPAASQPGQRFLRRPGSTSRAARSAFVRSAGALPRGASGDGPSRTVSALHPLPNFALHSRVWRGGPGRGGGGGAPQSAGGAGRRRGSPLDRALAVTWARRFPRTAAWGGRRVSASSPEPRLRLRWPRLPRAAVGVRGLGPGSSDESTSLSLGQAHATRRHFRGPEWCVCCVCEDEESRGLYFVP
ncbi:hypothetical protein NN561_011480 [Cricetulus griseus]